MQPDNHLVASTDHRRYGPLPVVVSLSDSVLRLTVSDELLDDEPDVFELLEMSTCVVAPSCLISLWTTPFDGTATDSLLTDTRVRVELSFDEAPSAVISALLLSAGSGAVGNVSIESEVNDDCGSADVRGVALL